MGDKVIGVSGHVLPSVNKVSSLLTFYYWGIHEVRSLRHIKGTKSAKLKKENWELVWEPINHFFYIASKHILFYSSSVLLQYKYIFNFEDNHTISRKKELQLNT